MAGGGWWQRRRARQGERRGERQWEQDLLREIRALETTDQGVDAGPVAPLPDSLPRPRQARTRPARARERRRTVLTVSTTLAIILGLFAFNLSPGSYQVRRLLGLDDRLQAEVDGGDSDAYAFLATRTGTDEPIGWSPCRPIVYQVNPDGAPDDWEDLVGDAVATISSSSGLAFEDAGVTDDRDFEDRFTSAGPPRPVLIGWATSEEVDGLAGDVAGLAGPVSRSRGPFQQYVSGRVVLDSDAFEDVGRLRGGDRQQRAILLHELGHLVGLDHVDDPSQLMYPTTQVVDLGRGDRRGLALVGRTPCG